VTVALRALARVNLAAIERNCARLAEIAGAAALCAVVKADGYGHGAIPAAHAALRGGARWLAVATAYEAAELREAGIYDPVLVMGALSESELDVAVRARADVTAWSERFVAGLAAHPEAAGIGVHVKLDTGMGRLGTRDRAEADRVVAAVANEPGLRLAGAMTHFATADDDHEFMRAQLAEFRPWAEAVKAAHPEVLVHAANSAALLADPATRFDLVRAGIAIYGLDPFHRDPADHGLEPALSLESWAATVKRCAPGQSCGYGRRFVAERETWIATLPIGYGDGVRRGLSNNADVLLDGRRVPLVGTVSMDNVTVDLGPGGEPPARIGAAAVLIGARDGERILAEDVAARLDTINYEVTCGISRRVPREYHRDGEPAWGGP
jgi:alanine racemase